MAASVLVDAGFLVALLSRRDTHHRWAVAQAQRLPPPWRTCEAVLSEAFHLLAGHEGPLCALLERQALRVAFDLGDEIDNIIRLIERYSGVPAGLADAVLVRMTETLAEPVILTTDSDFRIYRRHGRQVVPCVLPPA